MTCSKGTYVRSFAHDFGLALGTVAHLTALRYMNRAPARLSLPGHLMLRNPVDRREAIGEYSVANAWTIDEMVEWLRTGSTP
eukprot:scaffold706_cov418-Prasinococcus_capsulatus_cf.AAC.41